jgi:hypothetical protein
MHLYLKNDLKKFLRRLVNSQASFFFLLDRIETVSSIASGLWLKNIFVFFVSFILSLSCVLLLYHLLSLSDCFCPTDSLSVSLPLSLFVRLFLSLFVCPSLSLSLSTSLSICLIIFYLIFIDSTMYIFSLSFSFTFCVTSLTTSRFFFLLFPLFVSF